MKLVVIGLGQCGNRIADEFARLNNRAKTTRGIEIITGAFAVNTDAADLTGLSTIKSDFQHRILIGGRKTGGHGVGKINEMGAEIAKEDGDKVVDAIRVTKHFYETDAFLLIAGAAGGTGSGSISVMAQLIRERYGNEKPIYCLLVLPFEHEELNEARTVYNAAVCMKSVKSIADAVILFDNQRYVRKDSSLGMNLSKINAMIADTFYSMLCAGEEKKGKYIGAKVLDAGDIIQSLSGWTVIGYGKSNLPLITLPFQNSLNYRKKSTETHKGIQAMDEAISELSVRCRPADAGRGLYLVSAPAKEMNMDMIKEMGNYMKSLAPKAIIRNGDYPHRRGLIDVTVMFSDLNDVEKVREYYERSIKFMGETEIHMEEAMAKLKRVDDAGQDVPSLI